MKLNILIVLNLGLSLLSTVAIAKDEDIGDDGYNKTYNDDSKSFKDRKGTVLLGFSNITLRAGDQVIRYPDPVLVTVQ